MSLAPNTLSVTLDRSLVVIPDYKAWQAAPLTVSCAWPAGSTDTLSGASALTCEIRSSMTVSGAPISSLALTGGELTTAPYVFELTGADMNVTIPDDIAEQSFFLLIVATVGGEPDVLAAGRLVIRDNNFSGASVDPPGVVSYAPYAFKTIAVSGQSNVVAEGAEDTLTLVAGSGIALTTNATTDTITITSAGGGGTWGSITGTLADQTDLNSALGLKAPLISPSFTTPSLGVATATSINGNAFTAGTYTLTGSAGKTLTFSNTLTLAGTDASTLNIGTGGTLGTAAFLASSEGGNGAADAGKLVLFSGDGGITTQIINVVGAIVAGAAVYSPRLTVTGGISYGRFIQEMGVELTADREYTVPDASGTIALQEWTTAGFQPLDADLTTWAGITPAAGIGTFLAAPSGANLADALTSALPVSKGGTGLTAGTSGGVNYYSASGTLASSAALAANAIVIGGGAGAAPATTTTGTGVVTALGVNTGSAGAFVVNGGALGTPASGTVTNLTGTASININGTVGATTPGSGAFTTLSATGQTSITGASAVSAPAETLTGAWFTGGTSTTTKPHLLIEPSGATSTGWSTAGTGLGINSATGFTGNLIDLRANGNNRFNVNGAGEVTLYGNLYLDSSGVSMRNSNTQMLFGGNTISSIANTMRVCYGTHSQTSGTNSALLVNPIYNQTSGTASNTDLLINRTQTAIGSGQQNLIDCQVAGVSKYRVANDGAVVMGGVYRGSTSTRSGPGACDVVTETTKVTTTGALDALTLADGVDGQIKRLVHDVDGGSFVLTPTTKTGFTTFTSTAVGETVTLLFVTTRGWMVIGSFGGVIA